MFSNANAEKEENGFSILLGFGIRNNIPAYNGKRNKSINKNKASLTPGFASPSFSCVDFLTLGNPVMFSNDSQANYRPF